VEQLFRQWKFIIGQWILFGKLQFGLLLFRVLVLR